MQPIRNSVLKVVSSVEPRTDQAPEVVHDAAWVESQKENIRLGRSKRSNSELRIPSRYIGKTLANYDGDLVKKQAVDAIWNTNIFLWGPCGTGKSHLSCGLLAHCYAELVEYDGDMGSWKRPAARFVSCPDFLFDLKARIGSGESDLALIEALLNLDILVIDDFGAVRLTEYTQDVLSNVINKFYLQKTRGVIISSNLSLEDIAQKIDDRTASRIAEMCEVIKLDGPDRRLGH